MKLRAFFRNRLLLALPFAAGLCALWFYPWCGIGQRHSPTLLFTGSREGKLWAGASRVQVEPPYPVVMAGYPPPRSFAESALRPLYARALVLKVDDLKVGLVALDLLLVPQSLAEDVRKLSANLGLAHLWVTATHTHSSLGGYDPSLLSQFAGTGLYRPANHAAVTKAAALALSQAASSLVSAVLEAGEKAFPDLVHLRSEGSDPDGRLTRLVFKNEQRTVAQWIVFAAHPTLALRTSHALDPDYPGALSQKEEELGHGVTMLTQGALGNVSAAEGEDPSRVSHFSLRLASALQAVPVLRVEPVRLALTNVSIVLPAPDASRLVHASLLSLADRALCWAAPRRAELSEFWLGPMRFLFLPGEPTTSAERALQKATEGGRSVALTDGYLGYIEAPEVVRTRQGESKRQYFGPELLNTLLEAAQKAHRSSAFAR